MPTPLPPCPQPQYNTYIGARYIPIFAGEWDKTKTYEPLTVVSYQGNSFTSKTYVPANVDINNTTYWASTGNYNAQVEAYREEVENVKGQLDSIEQDIVELSYVTNQHYLKNKSVCIFGDSISDEQTAWNPALQPNWVAQFKQRFGNVCSKITNVSMSDRRITTQGSTPGIADIMGTSDLDFDIIIMFAGVNDFFGGIPLGLYYSNNVSEFFGALNKIGTLLKSSKATFYAVTPLPTVAVAANTAKFLPLQSYRSAIFDRARNFGWHIINGYNAPKLTGDVLKWAPDKVHPTALYAPYLCDYIVQKVCSGGDAYLANRNIWQQLAEIDPTVFTENFKNQSTQFYINYDTGFVHMRVSGTVVTEGPILNIPDPIMALQEIQFATTIRNTATPVSIIVNGEGYKQQIRVLGGTGSINTDIQFYSPHITQALFDKY